MDRKISDYLEYLENWQHSLPHIELSDNSIQREKCAIICVDMINGFCSIGPLSSQRVQGIVHPIVQLLKAAWDKGFRQIILTQDTHEPDAVEFASYPPHCVRGTVEADTIPEIKALPFYSKLNIIEKNSIHAGLNTGLDEWLSSRNQLDTFIIVGNCTDLCIYQMAMYLRLDANANQRSIRVIVPEDCVQTYGMDVEAALNVGALPHPGDLLHTLFLNHMAMNGIEIVKSIK